MNMTRPQTMAAAIESCKTALENCITSGNTEWEVRWYARLNALVDLIPSGGGIDRGPRTRSDLEIAPNAIRFDVSFHHMNENGYYDGWTDHTITVRPAFDGVRVSVSGSNRRDVKDYLHEVMEYAFTRRVTWDEPAQRWIVDSDPCSNPDCPKTIDGDAEHVDGACESAFNTQFPDFDAVAAAIVKDHAARAVETLASFEPRDVESCERFREAIATVRSAMQGGAP